MTLLRQLILSAFLTLFSILVNSNELLPESLHQNTLIRISESSLWSRLLHVSKQRRGGQFNSSIKNSDFFLDSDTDRTLYSELKLTVSSFSEDLLTDSTNPSWCDKPARLLFLSQEISQYDFDLMISKCETLTSWWDRKSKAPLSVIFVSNYFGNPASSFGHILVRLQDDKYDRIELLETAVNFGAKVPENENIMRYIVKGIFGGYDAQYTFDDMYKHDLVYTKSEYRDMWEYELQLTDYQRNLFILHIWELINTDFDYLFLSENCAYQVGELLEVAVDRELTTDGLPWYAPEQLFHDIDRRMPELFADTRFIPSQRRVAAAQFERLDQRERAVVEQIINGEQYSKSLNSFSIERRQMILSAALVYLIYKYPGSDHSEHPYYSIRKELIISRLRLPVGDLERDIPPASKEPVKTEPPAVLEVGLTLSDADSSGRIMFSPYSKSILSYGNYERSSLELLKTELSISAGSVQLESLTIIDLKELNPKLGNMPNDQHLNWRLNFGIQNDDQSCAGCGRFYADASIGKSAWMADNLSGYLLFDAQWYKQQGIIGFVAGIVADFGDNLRAEGESLVGMGTSSSDQVTWLQSKVSWSANASNSLLITLENSDQQGIELTWRHSF